ncbi:putative 39S ribosomal protein L49, mitochondrial [Lucilia cuprina]|uniref:Large ribosomal subunit protein mL49 n=1 Tax=Lucilia cuprina TaxID=7375 RepID=A0A0L0BX38_LUCCU|nr:probable 39S ribosomal protein L49, mitochondrial [Lucilia sericata]KAI8115409.1 mitochondrial, Probable 39S ribosomal protein L49 [Lucilia cuprina]KNC24575.1 putative 39S ribosomal protein L49, mitochondrial [Lucilia cuprina]
MALTQRFLKEIIGKTVKLPVTARFSSFLSSEKVRPLEEYPEVEVLKNPPEWKYVERLLPKKVVPKIEPKAEYPSGWKPPSVGLHNIDKVEYFVARSRNHMIPVYLEVTYRGQRRVTVVKHVQGNIWQLEKELRQLVEKARDGKLCATRVNEMSGQVRIHGDYVDIVREYLKSKGY